MTRETKVGLLVGMGVILLIGIIISDHLSVVQQQSPAEQMAHFAERAQESITPVAPPAIATSTDAGRSEIASPLRAPGAPRRETSVLQQMQTVPTPEELAEPDWRAAASETASETLAQAPAAELPQAYRLDQQTMVDAADPSAQRVPPRVPRITLSHLPGSDAVPSRTFIEDESVSRSWSPQASGQPPVPVAARVGDEAAAGSDIIHYVQPGETLYQIAQKYYGNGEYWRTIAAHNPDRVKSNGAVNQHVRLVVPNRAGLAALGGDFIPAGRELTHRLTPAVRPDPPKTITVEPGDTLSKLASDHLGSATRWRELLEANKDQLDRPENLRAGMKLKLPREPAAQAAQAPRVSAPPLRVLAARETPTAPAPAKQGASYVVKPGDSLYRIAAETLGDGERWRDIFEANRDTLTNADAVAVGQTLKIPD